MAERKREFIHTYYELSGGRIAQNFRYIRKAPPIPFFFPTAFSEYPVHCRFKKSSDLIGQVYLIFHNEILNDDKFRMGLINYFSMLIIKSSKYVTASAFVQNPTLPAAGKVLS